MPLNMPKIPDAEIAVIRDWIQQGLFETASSTPRGPVIKAPTEFKGSDLNRPSDAPAMPASLAALPAVTTARAHPVTALAASPWAPLIAVAEHERIAFYNLADRTPAGELAFPEGVPYLLRFSRDGSRLLAAGGKGVQSGHAVLFDVRTGARLAVIGDEPTIVLGADISADGKLVAIGGPSRVVKVFSVASGKQVYEIKKHTDWITAMEVSPDNATIATG